MQRPPFYDTKAIGKWDMFPTNLQDEFKHVYCGRHDLFSS